MLILLSTFVAAAGARLYRATASDTVVLVAFAIGGHALHELALRARLSPRRSLGVASGLVAMAAAQAVPTTYFGVPTAATLALWRRTWAELAADAAHRHVPALPPATLGISCLIAGLTGVASRALWRDGRSGALAAFPASLAFCVAVAIAPARVGVAESVLFCLCALATVAATEAGAYGGTSASSSRARRAAARHARKAWKGPRAPRLTWSTPAIVGGTVLLAFVLAKPALDARFVLPTFHLSGAGGGGGGGADLAEIASMQPLFGSDAGASQPMFVVDTSQASYWQLTTLDAFDGTAWHPAANPPRLPGPEDHPAGPSATVITQVFDIQSLVSHWLPAAPGLVGFANSVPQGASRIGDSIEIPGVSARGQNYAVESAEATAAADDAPGALPAQAGTDLSLPPLPTGVGALARRIVAGDATPYAKASSLLAFFRSGAFHYSLTAPPSGSDTGPLMTFLTVSRTGFCQQFAAAYAVLARADGLPARVAIGFTPGTLQPDGTYEVTSTDAHAWPEVYLGPRAGWLSLEPTPPAPGAAVEPAPDVIGGGQYGPPPPATTVPVGATTLPVGVTTLPATTTAAPPTTRPAARKPVRWKAVPAAAAPRRGFPGTEVLGIALVVIGAAAFCLSALLVARRRRRAQGDPGGDEEVPAGGGLLGFAFARGRRARRRAIRLGPVNAEWAETVALLGRSGIGTRASETHREFAARAGSRLRFSPAATTDLAELAALSAKELFAAMACNTEEIRLALTLAQHVRQELAGAQAGRAADQVERG